MAGAVVHGFQPVDIDESENQATVLPLGPLNFVLDRDPPDAALIGTGQVVEMRSLERDLRLFAVAGGLFAVARCPLSILGRLGAVGRGPLARLGCRFASTCSYSFAARWRR